MRIRAFPLHQNLVSRCFSKPPMHFSNISLYVIMMQVWWAGPIQSNLWPKFQPKRETFLTALPKSKGILLPLRILVIYFLSCD